MEGVKGFFASKTIWGLIVAGLGFVMSLFGYTFTEADQASLLTTIGNLAEGVGMLFALYGRVTTKKAIGW